MAKTFYRILMIIAVLLCIFFLGAIIGIANPIKCLLVTIGIAALITLGYILGSKSEGGKVFKKSQRDDFR